MRVEGGIRTARRDGNQVIGRHRQSAQAVGTGFDCVTRLCKERLSHSLDMCMAG